MVLTHPDRLVWPSLRIRKIDLARYVEAVGARFLPHLAGRPLTLVRCPDGAEAKCFYQRHRPGSKEYMRFTTLEEVLRAVQNGAVEFHTWGATAPDLAHPDRITLDLDPGPGVTWKALVEATTLARAALEHLGLKAFLKTREIARSLVRARPDLFVANMSKKKRGGKVFVDYLRNGETASAIAAFSPRARKQAGVAMPVSWDELGRKDLRKRFTVKTVPKLLDDGDPWKGYGKAGRRITSAMKKAGGWV